MKLSFHGAARTVTGSKHLLHLKNGKKLLLDCGMFQGMGRDTDSLNRDPGFDARDVDAMILSHAHIDHSGLIPKLVGDGFGGRIFCTPATFSLTQILLEDSAVIQESDTIHSNRRRSAQGQQLMEPLYSKQDAEKSISHFEQREYGEWFPVLEGVEAMFTDAGHIIGSACVHLRVTENRRQTAITFSGDIGRYRDIILKSPQPFPQADYIIMESTYGNSLHDPADNTTELLLKWINHTCFEKRGKLVMPAFSVGRTQELLFALNQLELEKRLPPIPYLVDSPLSREATEVISSYPEYFNNRIQKIMKSDADPFDFTGLRYVKTVDESKQINYRNEPMVIISASGMADAGRVKHHISNTIENTRNTILFTGYCEPNSLGGRLMAGASEVNIFSVQHQVNAEIGSIRSMSAHGDYEDMSQWLGGQDKAAVKELFLVHGEYDVQQAFADRLIKKGFRNVSVPDRHTVVDLH